MVKSTENKERNREIDREKERKRERMKEKNRSKRIKGREIRENYHTQCYKAIQSRQDT